MGKVGKVIGGGGVGRVRVEVQVNQRRQESLCGLHLRQPVHVGTWMLFPALRRNGSIRSLNGELL